MGGKLYRLKFQKGSYYYLDQSGEDVVPLDWAPHNQVIARQVISTVYDPASARSSAAVG